MDASGRPFLCSLFIVLYLWTILTAFTTLNYYYRVIGGVIDSGEKSEHILYLNHGFIVKHWTITRIFVIHFISFALILQMTKNYDGCRM